MAVLLGKMGFTLSVRCSAVKRKFIEGKKLAEAGDLFPLPTPSYDLNLNSL